MRSRLEAKRGQGDAALASLAATPACGPARTFLASRLNLVMPSFSSASRRWLARLLPGGGCDGDERPGVLWKHAVSRPYRKGVGCPRAHAPRSGPVSPFRGREVARRRIQAPAVRRQPRAADPGRTRVWGVAARARCQHEKYSLRAAIAAAVAGGDGPQAAHPRMRRSPWSTVRHVRAPRRGRRGRVHLMCPLPSPLPAA